MGSHYEAPIRRPLVTGEKSYHDVTLDVVAPVEGKANKLWWIVFSIALTAFAWGLGCMVYTISTGIGTGVSIKLLVGPGTLQTLSGGSELVMQEH